MVLPKRWYEHHMELMCWYISRHRANSQTESNHTSIEFVTNSRQGKDFWKMNKIFPLFSSQASEVSLLNYLLLQIYSTLIHETQIFSTCSHKFQLGKTFFFTKPNSKRAKHFVGRETNGITHRINLSRANDERKWKFCLHRCEEEKESRKSCCASRWILLELKDGC